MKLSTYSFLTSRAIKGVKVGYPLKLEVEKKIENEIEFNGLFIERLLPKIDWPVLYEAARVLELTEDVPAELPTSLSDNEDLLRKIHHILLEVEVVEGKLTCPETGRVFPITEGIPNMVLNEYEV